MQGESTHAEHAKQEIGRGHEDMFHRNVNGAPTPLGRGDTLEFAFLHARNKNLRGLRPSAQESSSLAVQFCRSGAQSRYEFFSRCRFAIVIPESMDPMMPRKP
jgi:hypothetical protein